MLEVLCELGRDASRYSHKDKSPSSPIGAESQYQNTNENCVPRYCKECVDGKTRPVCDQSARFMHSTDIGVPPGPVKSSPRDITVRTCLFCNSCCERGDDIHATANVALLSMFPVELERHR